jgi:hypothetical protein
MGIKIGELKVNNELCEDPVCDYFLTVIEKRSSDKVHSLHVSYLRHVSCDGNEDSLKLVLRV